MRLVLYEGCLLSLGNFLFKLTTFLCKICFGKKNIFTSKNIVNYVNIKFQQLILAYKSLKVCRACFRHSKFLKDLEIVVLFIS